MCKPFYVFACRFYIYVNKLKIPQRISTDVPILHVISICNKVHMYIALYGNDNISNVL